MAVIIRGSSYGAIVGFLASESRAAFCYFPLICFNCFAFYFSFLRPFDEAFLLFASLNLLDPIHLELHDDVDDSIRPDGE